MWPFDLVKENKRLRNRLNDEAAARLNSKVKFQDRIKELSERADQLEHIVHATQGKTNVRYVQIQAFNEGDPRNDYLGGSDQYQEWVVALLDDDRFKWLIHKTNMEFIDIMKAINPGDSNSAEIRIRAAHRMDGIQMLIERMEAIRRARQAYLRAEAEKEAE
jgi:hypothetical protein